MTAAIKHLGTNANNSISKAIVWVHGFNSGIVTADMATMALAITDDVNNAHPVVPSAFSYDGGLFIPNRGVLKLRKGDVVAVDSTGWPILLSARAINSGPWTFA